MQIDSARINVNLRSGSSRRPSVVAPAVRVPDRIALLADGMSAIPPQPLPLLQTALLNWENEGGARAERPSADRAAQPHIAQSVSTELEHLRIRMIAMENLLITILAQAPDRQLELGREMAAYISPRPGFARHPRTVDAAAQIVHLLDRARPFQGWVEGDALS
jgi:hypothetical protein